MKLLFCAYCRDVLKLQSPAMKKRTCACGRSAGHYLTTDPADARAVVTGDYVQVIAIANDSLLRVSYGVAVERPRNLGLDRYTTKDDYWLEQHEIAAWMYGPNALEVTRNTTAKTPRSISPTPASRRRRKSKT